jgi:F-type H+-transporting ATPase subunit c
MKKCLVIVLLLGIFVGASFSLALAAEEAKGLDSNVKQMVALAAGFGVAIAAFGGALGQGRGVAAALEGIARNPGASGKILTPMIIGLALIESLVIYALVVSLLLFFKL